MTNEEIYEVLRTLAQGQGLYGRILSALASEPEKADEIFADMREKGVKDAVDVVLYFEQ